MEQKVSDKFVRALDIEVMDMESRAGDVGCFGEEGGMVDDRDRSRFSWGSQ